MVIGLGHFYTLPASTDYAHPNHGLNSQAQNLIESRSPDGPDASCSVAFSRVHSFDRWRSSVRLVVMKMQSGT
jgi:hypothetical protein